MPTNAVLFRKVKNSINHLDGSVIVADTSPDTNGVLHISVGFIDVDIVVDVVTQDSRRIAMSEIGDTFLYCGLHW